MSGTEMAEVILSWLVCVCQRQVTLRVRDLLSVKTNLQCWPQANEQIIKDVNRWSQSVASQQQ